MLTSNIRVDIVPLSPHSFRGHCVKLYTLSLYTFIKEGEEKDEQVEIVALRFVSRALSKCQEIYFGRFFFFLSAGEGWALSEMNFDTGFS